MMRWLVLAAYIAIGVGSALGSFTVRPSQEWGALGQVIFWPVTLGVVIGKMATMPDDVDTE